LPRGEGWHQWEGGGLGTGGKRVNICTCIVNEKMIPAETIPGIGGKGE
jgi:hypothetical protein